ncbi:uncharacterized protein LOC133191596 [Saccostrea echinata]|uniref:uncharacterized protein LOC133191596 n=1 Tax=Saccostrea echinata TaxID=191078 RepID=UPI002A7F0C68|nr:uncharacterized protein LOC133191596 [Saccostrea echinata]
MKGELRQSQISEGTRQSMEGELIQSQISGETSQSMEGELIQSQISWETRQSMEGELIQSQISGGARQAMKGELRQSQISGGTRQSMEDSLWKVSYYRVRLVEGPDSLWKVTYRKDLFAAQGILRENLSFIFIEEEITNQRDNIISSITEENLKVSSEKSPSCSEFGFVFFLSPQRLESDIATKIDNISVMMNKITSHQYEKCSDCPCNESISESTKKEDCGCYTNTDETEVMVCSKCSFLTKKTIVLLHEINKLCRSTVVENTRERLLGARLPDNVFMSVIVFHEDSESR